MIEILFDPYQINNFEEHINIKTPLDYIKSRLDIHSDLLREYHLIIQNPGMRNYYDDLTMSGLAIFKEFDPVKILLSLFQGKKIHYQSIKDNPKIVIELDLIKKAEEIPFPLEEIESIEDWVLYVFLKSPWHKHQINHFNDLKEIITIINKFITNEQHPYIKNLCYEKLNHFESSNKIIYAVLKWLCDDPFNRSMYIEAAKAIEKYPEEKKALWLQKNGVWSEICQIPDYKTAVSLLPFFTINANNDVLPNFQISQFLQERFSIYQSDNEIIHTLDMISGYLQVEIEEVNRYLQQSVHKGDIVDNSILNKIIDQFRGDESKDLRNLAIKMLKPYEIPSLLSSDSSWSKVKSWLMDEYFPYYKWLKYYGKLNDTIPIINSFEEWLIKNYANLQWENSVFISGIIRNDLNYIKTLGVNKFSFLLVIIDGIGFTQTDTIKDHANSINLFSTKNITPHLAFLPTLTDVNKAALLRGQMPNQMFQNKYDLSLYKKIFAEFLEVDESAVFCSSDRKKNIADVLKEKFKYYLYFLNTTDSYIHENISEKNREDSIEKEISLFFSNLKDGINSYSNLNDSPLFISIVSDHGYTPTIEYSVGISVPMESKTSHCRVLMDACNDISENEYYRIDYKNNIEKVFIARKYNYFGSKPKGAVHGGMTPQEITIPSFLLSSNQISDYKPLILEIDGVLRRGKEDNLLKLGIINPNLYEFNLQQIIIDSKPITSNMILHPKGSTSIDFIFDALYINSQRVEVSVYIKYEVQGQDKYQEDLLIVQSIGAASANLDFEDMFDV